MFCVGVVRALTLPSSTLLSLSLDLSTHPSIQPSLHPSINIYDRNYFIITAPNENGVSNVEHFTVNWMGIAGKRSLLCSVCCFLPISWYLHLMTENDFFFFFFKLAFDEASKEFESFFFFSSF